MTSSPIRVAVLGCGNVAQMMHLPHIRDLEEKFELVALADLYEPILDAVGDHYHVPKARRYNDMNTLFAQDDVDAVVMTHAGSHRDAVVGAVEACKHVFVEKPLAWNLREFHEVEAVVEASDRTVQLGYHKRYDPAFFYAREQVRQMTDIGFVRITVLHPPDEMGHSPHRIRRGNGVIKEGHIDVMSWQEQVENQLKGLAGGDLSPLVDEALGSRKDDPALRLAYGIVTISCIHQVYTLFGFLGAPEGVVSTEVWRDGLSIHTVMQYPDFRCSMDWHFLSHLKSYNEEYAFYGNYERVTFQLPSPYFRNFPSPVIVQKGDGELSYEQKVTVSYDEAFRNEMIAFHDNIRNGTLPDTNVQEAVEHQTLIQQIIDAVP